MRVFYSLYEIGIRIAFAGAENGDTGGFSNGVCDLWNIPVVIGGWRECVGTVRIEGQGADTCDSGGLARCIDGRVTGDAEFENRQRATGARCVIGKDASCDGTCILQA